jgi:hypothetical protein
MAGPLQQPQKHGPVHPSAKCVIGAFYHMAIIVSGAIVATVDELGNVVNDLKD